MASKKGLDFESFSLEKDADAGIDVVMVDPRSDEEFEGIDGKPIVITVRGMDSDIWTKRIDRIAKRNAEKYKKRNVPTSVVRGNFIEAVASVVMGWSKNIPWQGEVLEFTPDNALKLLGMSNGFSDQLLSEITNRANLKKN